MEALFLILSILSFVLAVAVLIGNVINHGFKSLLSAKGTKVAGLSFGAYVIFFLLFLFVAN